MSCYSLPHGNYVYRLSGNHYRSGSNTPLLIYSTTGCRYLGRSPIHRAGRDCPSPERNAPPGCSSGRKPKVSGPDHRLIGRVANRVRSKHPPLRKCAGKSQVVHQWKTYTSRVISPAGPTSDRFILPSHATRACPALPDVTVQVIQSGSLWNQCRSLLYENPDMLGSGVSMNGPDDVRRSLYMHRIIRMPIPAVNLQSVRTDTFMVCHRRITPA